MENPSYFTRLPESMELADIGPYFRGLREHYGLSEHDVSARLHIRVKYIQAIEASDMSQLPGKVYARGYIATYAEFLGIDPEHAVERFLGTETKEKPEEYFVPEPARLSGPLQRNLRLAAAALVVILFGYLFFGGDSSDNVVDDESTVVPVPEALVESSRSLIAPIGKSLRCVDASSLMACLQPAAAPLASHPLQHPNIFTASAPWKPAKIMNETREMPKPAKETAKSEETAVKIIKPEPKKKEASESLLPWLQ